MSHLADARWPLPQGVVDLLYEDAADKRGLEAALRGCFRVWSYDELIAPTFEYADTLASEAGTQLAEEMYRFTDRDGRTLALRPELTIPAARVAATRLYDQAMPLRLCYIGPVFRYEAPQAGRQREFTQAGVELIGAAGPAADAEVLALTAEALRTAGLTRFQLALGQMAFFHALLVELNLTPVALHTLQSALDRKNAADIAAALAAIPASPALHRTLLALPALSGGPVILHTARTLCLNPAMTAALDHLAALHELLHGYGVADHITFDLGETRAMQYYTGITFKGYTPGVGFAICSGGRYDDLLAHFGRPQPAVGCALWVDRIALARQRQGWQPSPLRADLLWLGELSPACLAALIELRRRGLRVELHLGDAAVDVQSARAPRLAHCVDADTVRLRTAEGTRTLSITALMHEAATW
ncbi:MAG: ATP phosphoribosyltransferase regulatory subunit [Caldilineales bacterium]